MEMSRTQQKNLNNISVGPLYLPLNQGDALVSRGWATVQHLPMTQVYAITDKGREALASVAGNVGYQRMLERVKSAAGARDETASEWRDAIIAAHEAGISLRRIGEAAGVSHVRVLQIVRAQ